MTRQKALALRALIEKAAVGLDDSDALNGIELFPKWSVGTDYTFNDRVRFDGKLYKCVQPHISQPDWTPPDTPALWTEVAEPGTIPVWRQPTGAQDAYQTGDRVWYPAKDTTIYESLIDNNVYSPEAYPAGWAVV